MTSKHSEQQSETPSDIRGCRVIEISPSSFAECLRSGPNSCQYALPFGYCFLCQHPRLDDIIENSKKMGRPIRAAN